MSICLQSDTRKFVIGINFCPRLFHAQNFQHRKRKIEKINNIEIGFVYTHRERERATHTHKHIYNTIVLD